ncbi:hypothetical protein EGR_08099 [Echinococcus granulosus]|uniref:Uncharacterized protein n=1 Tax=Echinococcus granulosus TaxID=6210 RepID=W6U718_ECHGR|nr:hypothetical protein EGR_08099 [Echinococcus granulosus]EUB57023.1 hypothetical protein EGR_08099 [Echinococcus granulosus]
MIIMNVEEKDGKTGFEWDYLTRKRQIWDGGWDQEVLPLKGQEMKGKQKKTNFKYTNGPKCGITAIYLLQSISITKKTNVRFQVILSDYSVVVSMKEAYLQRNARFNVLSKISINKVGSDALNSSYFLLFCIYISDAIYVDYATNKLFNFFQDENSQSILSQ